MSQPDPPEWANELFFDDELEEGNFSIGIVVDGSTGNEYKAFIEHFDGKFRGEVRAFFFDKEKEILGHETKEEYDKSPNDDSYYVKEYTSGYKS